MEPLLVARLAAEPRTARSNSSADDGPMLYVTHVDALDLVYCNREAPVVYDLMLVLEHDARAVGVRRGDYVVAAGVSADGSYDCATAPDGLQFVRVSASGDAACQLLARPAPEPGAQVVAHILEHERVRRLREREAQQQFVKCI